MISQACLDSASDLGPATSNFQEERHAWQIRHKFWTQRGRRRQYGQWIGLWIFEKWKLLLVWENNMPLVAACDHFRLQADLGELKETELWDRWVVTHIMRLKSPCRQYCFCWDLQSLLRPVVTKVCDHWQYVCVTSTCSKDRPSVDWSFKNSLVEQAYEHVMSVWFVIKSKCI